MSILFIRDKYVSSIGFPLISRTTGYIRIPNFNFNESSFKSGKKFLIVVILLYATQRTSIFKRFGELIRVSKHSEVSQHLFIFKSYKLTTYLELPIFLISMLLNSMLLRSNLVKEGFFSFESIFGMSNSKNQHASKFISSKDQNFKAAQLIIIPIDLLNQLKEKSIDLNFIILTLINEKL